jgi:hypothetical protein
MKQSAFILFSLLLIHVQPLWADAPVVEAASASAQNGAWRFDVTLSHPDTGWDHYADGWRVLDMAGTELGLRVLTHPHEHEQPFTRSLSGVVIAEGVTQVQIQARDTQDGWADATYVVSLPD